MNEKTRKWFKETVPYLTEDHKFLLASPGMLMGMMNAASTTVGILKNKPQDGQ